MLSISKLHPPFAIFRRHIFVIIIFIDQSIYKMDQINELGFNETIGGMYCYPTNEDALLANNNEHALLEKTRCELLNGNDFWWCPRCAVGVPSLALACGECNDTISFVPLELEEFESFVRKQREKNVRNNASELWKQQATKEKQREEESGDESNSSESESEDEDEHVNNVCLVTPNEESLVTPYLFYIMKHVRKSHLESLDNGARSAAFESGKPGLECMYCNGGRKFFYRDASVLSGTFNGVYNTIRFFSMVYDLFNMYAHFVLRSAIVHSTKITYRYVTTIWNIHSL